MYRVIQYYTGTDGSPQVKERGRVDSEENAVQIAKEYYRRYPTVILSFTIGTTLFLPNIESGHRNRVIDSSVRTRNPAAVRVFRSTFGLFG